MSKVKIYGASDDLIEVEGDTNDEFNLYDDEKALLAFGDGTVVSVVYDEHGCWRVNRVAAGSATFEKVEADGADTDRYSDEVTLEGDLRWMLYSKSKGDDHGKFVTVNHNE